ncbi:MAG: hypothetical protein ACHQHO_08460 [Solirubrobacterales bacterium]
MLAKAQRALPQIVACAEQEVDLGQPALLRAGISGVLRLRASNETPSLSVWGTVGHRPEQRLADGRLVLTRLQRQPGIELVGIGSF